jgi:putative colanic acid biosysnthesis UDP-glucose lipid carrier transferase
MQNRKKTERQLKTTVDNLFLILSFLVAVFLAKRHVGMHADFFSLRAGEIYLLLFLCLAWNVASRAMGFYDEFRVRSLANELSVLGENISLQVFWVVVILFVTKSRVLSRFFVFAFYLLLLALLMSWKMLSRLFFSWRQNKGRNLTHILIVGNGNVASNFIASINNSRQRGYRIRGFVADRPDPENGGEYLGAIDQLAQVLERERVDEVVITLPNSELKKIAQVIDACEGFPVQVRIIPDYFKFMNPRFGISRFGNFPIISIRANPLEEWHWRVCKRCFDLVLTLLLFIGVFSWLWPLLALAIKISSPGPVFFKQERWGKKNARIICYKFRSMVKESRDVDENGHYQQATRNDRRITRLGGFLRRSNLDELPQFINVLKGEMSVVGPRPHPTPMNLEIKDSIHNYQLRHLVRPGITGWAQVSGFRGETSDPDLLCKRVEYDIWYIENWSILLDVKIVWLSIWLMLKGDPRAY